MPTSRATTVVFLRRVRGQPADTQTLLLVAAADESGDLGLVLAAAAELGVDPAALDAAETADLVRIHGAVVSFRHPLVRSAVYRGATSRQRRAAEYALAAVLDGDEEADRRAWHLAAAAVGSDETAAESLERSAERARQRGGHASAASALERAAGLTAGAEARARRFAAAAEAAWLAGQSDRARSLLDRAGRFAGDPLLRGRIERLRATIEFRCGTPETAYAIFLTGAALVADSPPGQAAALVADAGQVAFVVGNVAGMNEVIRRLADLPTPDGTVAVTTRVLTGLATFMAGDLAGATPLVHEAARLAEELDVSSAFVLAAGAAVFVGDDEGALALYNRAVIRARLDGAISGLPLTLAPLASMEAWTGRYASATATAGEGLRLSRETGQDNPAAHHQAVLALVAAVQGRAEECRELAGAALAHATEFRLGPPTGLASWALALLDLGAGRAVEACGRLRALVDGIPRQGHPMIRILVAADLVDAATRAGQHEAAAVALAPLDEWASEVGVPWGQALVARCRGLLAAGPEVERYFTEALALHTRGGRPFDTARTALRYGEILRRQRRRAEARIHLRTACEGFERLGAGPWAEQARTELRATGETARKRDPSTFSQLTPQELQIARFVGEGATNREIAAQLFLSPRTVDYHLHKVFTKLGMSSRTELVRLSLQDNGLRER